MEGWKRKDGGRETTTWDDEMAKFKIWSVWAVTIPPRKRSLSRMRVLWRKDATVCGLRICTHFGDVLDGGSGSVMEEWEEESRARQLLRATAQTPSCDVSLQLTQTEQRGAAAVR